MRHAKAASRRTPASASASVTDSGAAKVKRGGGPAPGFEEKTGLRERKKARLRQQIVETALHLFRQRGYETVSYTHLDV